MSGKTVFVFKEKKNECRDGKKYHLLFNLYEVYIKYQLHFKYKNIYISTYLFLLKKSTPSTTFQKYLNFWVKTNYLNKFFQNVLIVANKTFYTG